MKNLKFEDIQQKKMQNKLISYSNDKKIKAAGGIKDFEDAEKFIAAGADRLGTSKLVNAMLKEQMNKITYKTLSIGKNMYKIYIFTNRGVLF